MRFLNLKFNIIFLKWRFFPPQHFILFTYFSFYDAICKFFSNNFMSNFFFLIDILRFCTMTIKIADCEKINNACENLQLLNSFFDEQCVMKFSRVRSENFRIVPDHEKNNILFWQQLWESWRIWSIFPITKIKLNSL